MADLEKLYNAIERASETAYGSDDSDLSNQRAASIAAYLGANTMPAPDGRSQVVDRTVYETIQWILPSLARIFANGDDVVELPPLGPDDEEGAKQEAQYLNYLALQKNNWFEVFTTAAKDALLTKTGYLYAYREKRRQVEIEQYERQTQEGVALILQDKPEVLDMKEYPEEDAQPQPAIDPATGQPAIGPDGQPVMQPPPMLYDLQIRRVKEEVGYCIDALPPERVRVSEKHKQVQLVGCPYFEYYDWDTISNLRRDGYDVEDDVSSDGDPYEAPEDVARDQFAENASDQNTVDPAQRRVLVRYVWIAHDTDEDGISELNACVVVGKKVVHREECNDIPVGVLCPDPLPHRHVGLCPADTTADIQAIKTVTIRNGLDNLQLSNNPRTFIDPSMVNLDDLLVSRPGGVVRGKPGSIFGQHISPFPIPFVFPQVIEAMGFFEQMTEGRTGVNRYFQGTDSNAMNKTASGVAQLSTMAAQRVEQIARHFANGVERVFCVLHSLVLKGGHKKETVRLRNKWIDIDPATWRRRTDFRISVGYSAGNKDAAVQRLLLLGQKQGEAMAGGLPIVTPQNLYETAIELTKAADFSAPERFWTDPTNAPPKGPPQPDPTVMAVEQLKAQTTKEVKGAELQNDQATTQATLTVEKYKADLEAQTKLQIEQMQREHQAQVEAFRAESTKEQLHIKGAQAETTDEGRVKLRKLAKQHGVQIEPQKDDIVTHEEAEQIQQSIAQVSGSVQQMAQFLEQLAGTVNKAITATRKVRRGKDGRAEGVDMVSADGEVLHSQKVQRGADGRVEGVA